jgi:L-ribulose-5-phosphate 4-epimerase
MLEKLKAEVLAANLELEKRKLVVYTWGNVSGFDATSKRVVIKPSGVPYEALTEEHMVVLDLEGNILEGDFKPSSDTPTHLYLYRHFPGIGGIVHTHSTWATVWAQSRRNIPCLGTTHADHFYGEIPCTRRLTKEEILHDYELNTGKVIVERFTGSAYLQCPGVLVASHAPFTWGKSSWEAVCNSVILEEVAKMAFLTKRLSPHITQVSQHLLDKHFLRKHGANAYYGQAGNA